MCTNVSRNFSITLLQNLSKLSQSLPLDSVDLRRGLTYDTFTNYLKQGGGKLPYTLKNLKYAFIQIKLTQNDVIILKCVEKKYFYRR